MLFLGLSGGLDPAYDSRLFKGIELHDSAAVLLRDGEVIAAVEEERLNRIKHTNSMPIEAIRACLNWEGARLSDLDAVAISCDESIGDIFCRDMASYCPQKGDTNIRSLVHRFLRENMNDDIADEKLHFVPHHLAHALSAYAPSGFDSSLVVTIDGVGDELSGTVFSGRGDTLKQIVSLGESKSLGHFYAHVVQYLGFGNFDEYKVMGLAPYGDPSVHRDLFRGFYALLANGTFEIHWNKLGLLERECGSPRQSEQEILQSHKDIAASLQESLETIVQHLLSYYRETTGHMNLCMAGGVAQNSSLNGKLLCSGKFKNIFIQPAAYDAGCALGAALWAQRRSQPRQPVRAMTDVFWGPATLDISAIETELSVWRDFVSFRKSDDIAAETARLLADGSIVGWVQGRMEFGARALGHRSIIADPRPAANKDIVNAMVKKREQFRPFAPATLEEDADEYFELPNGADLGYMTFVVPVREHKRALLGATTHVDGSARLQTVRKSVDPAFWELISAFKAITGVGVVLNTSFNNNAEPIVNSVEDAITCFLTSGLHMLVIGPYLVRKNKDLMGSLHSLVPVVPQHVRLLKKVFHVSKSCRKTTCEIVRPHSEASVQVSRAAFTLLEKADGEATIHELHRDFAPDTLADALYNELWSLWQQRLVFLRAAPIADEIPASVKTLTIEQNAG